MEFNTLISASPEKIWDILWSDVPYRTWTAVFCEGSHAVSDWKKGSKILFLDGKKDGMVSRIADFIPSTYASFQHLGEVKQGNESIEVGWENAFENYRLIPRDGATELVVSMTFAEQYEDFKAYFEKTMPLALQKIKELAEER